MRIAFLAASMPQGPVGGLRIVYEYANRLAARGHSVSVVHPRRFPPPKNLRGWARYETVRILDSFSPIVPPKIEWQTIDRRVRMLYVPGLEARWVPDGDAVFATFWTTAEPVLRYPKSKGAKFHLIQHYETWAGPKERVDATWRAPLHKVVVSRWLYERGLDLGCQHMQYIPNGIDGQRYRLLNPVSARPKRIAMLFHQEEWKGCSDGLRALRIVKERHPGVEVVVFGAPQRDGCIPAWMEYLENPPQAELIGNVYNGSSIFVCPSWAEGFGLPAAEAMACGCAVASTDCGGNLDYAEHETTALLSPPHRPEALARNIIRLLEDDALRQRLAAAGHDRVKAFNWQRSTDQLEQFILNHAAR